MIKQHTSEEHFLTQKSARFQFCTTKMSYSSILNGCCKKSSHFYVDNNLFPYSLAYGVGLEPYTRLCQRGHSGRVVTLSPPTSEAGGSIPVKALCGKAGSCLPLVGSLQYTTLANSMYWFPLPFQLPVVI